MTIVIYINGIGPNIVGRNNGLKRVHLERIKAL